MLLCSYAPLEDEKMYKLLQIHQIWLNKNICLRTTDLLPECERGLGLVMVTGDTERLADTVSGLSWPVLARMDGCPNLYTSG